jgi:hypothetical protein
MLAHRTSRRWYQGSRCWGRRGSVGIEVVPSCIRFGSVTSGIGFGVAVTVDKSLEYTVLGDGLEDVCLNKGQVLMRFGFRFLHISC